MWHVEISGAVRADHEEVREILADAFVGAPEGVEVHVKARRQRVTWRAVCAAMDCHPANWSGPGADYHWFTKRKDLELFALKPSHGPVERVVHPAGFTGRAYNGIPRMAKVLPGMRYLVTLHMPTNPAAQADGYPAVRRYPGLKTAPPVAVACWREELFAVAAHEARHLMQFEHGLRVSEIDAERAAVEALEAWRRPPVSAVVSAVAAGRDTLLRLF